MIVSGNIIFMGATSLLLVLSIIFLSISYGVGKKIKEKKKLCTNKIVARVIKMTKGCIEESIGIEHSRLKSWFPGYEYTINGQLVRVNSNFGQEQKIFQPGQEVDLYYNPNNYHMFFVPEERIDRLPKIMGVVGTILSMCTIGLIIGYYFIIIK